MDMKNEITVSKKVSFDAAHYLPGYDGKCANLHGHHWVVELGVKGSLDEQTGMVVDFTVLKFFLSQIQANLDHHLLNDVLPNPTAENLVFYIKSKFYEQLWGLEGVKLDFIRVWETEDSMAELKVGG